MRIGIGEPQVPAKMSLRALTHPELVTGGPGTTIGEAIMGNTFFVSPMIVKGCKICKDRKNERAGDVVGSAILDLSSGIGGPPDPRQTIVGLQFLYRTLIRGIHVALRESTCRANGIYKSPSKSNVDCFETLDYRLSRV